MKRGNLSRPKSSNDKIINALAVVAIIVVTVLVSLILYFYVQLSSKKIDEDSLCPINGEVGYLAIVLDLTDPLTSQQTIRLKREIKRLINLQEEGTLISVGVVHFDEAKQGSEFSICKPASGEEANNLYENKSLIEETYLKEFKGPLHTRIDAMMYAEELPNSPIIESITALVSSNTGIKDKEIPKTLILVSDLVQNSDALSFFKGEDWYDFSRKNEIANLTRILKDFRIRIIRIPRLETISLDYDGINDFWVRYLEAHRVKSIQLDQVTLGKL